LLPLTRFFLATGILMVFPGALAGWYGAVKMQLFFRALPAMGQLTVRQLMRELIFPHTLFLFGFGCFVFGLLLILKAVVFHREHRPAHAAR